jgi:opacity protein-like surface antigen
MSKLIVSAALALALAVPLQAQQAGEPVTAGHGSVYVGPYAGYMIFGELFDFGASEMSMDDDAFYGAQVGWSFSPNFTLLGNIAYAKSPFTITDAGGTRAASGDLGVFFYDANLQFRLPFVSDATRETWIAPFGQIGAGAIKYSTDTDDFDGPGSTNVAFNLGLGADFQLTNAIGLRLMAKDYITSLAWDDIGSVNFDDEVDNNTAHNFALTVGLNFGF